MRTIKLRDVQRAIDDDAASVELQRLVDAVDDVVLTSNDYSELDAMLTAYDAELLRTDDVNSATLAACECSSHDYSLDAE